MADIQKLRKELQESEDKLKVFENQEGLFMHIDADDEFYKLVKEFLTDQEKIKFMYSQNLGGYFKKNIILTIENETYVKEILKNKNAIKDISNNEVREIIKNLSNDEDKKELIGLYEFSENNVLDIIKTFKNKENKIEEIEKDKFMPYEKKEIIKSFTPEQLIEFINNNRDICEKNNIKIYEVTSELEDSKQIELVKNIEKLNITLNEKREILALLKQEVKEQIDTTNLPEEYKTAIKMKKGKYSSWIEVDLNQNLEDYKGLDNIIRENAQNLNQEQRKRFLELCDICPNMEVISNIGVMELTSTPAEYKRGEEWIEGVLGSIKPEYTDAQKIAIIDNAIGKKLSYSPDFELDRFEPNDARAIWTIINKGYGICNGVANLMEYMLKRVGIENVKQVDGKGHTFLKMEGIELPLANGEKVKGNTIIDPTWNLSENRFGAKPENIFINYETARKHDIDSMGKDYKSHQNDEELLDATLELDDESFKELYKSVGLTDKEGNFPIENTIEKSENIDRIYANEPEKNINEQFALLKEICPEYTTCQNSTISIIANVLLHNKNQQIKGGNVNIVYDKADKNKEPVLYTYIELENSKELFYYADKEYEQFVKISKEKFEEKFACYEEKLIKGIEPWKVGKTEEKERLENTSEKIEKEEGEER